MLLDMKMHISKDHIFTGFNFAWKSIYTLLTLFLVPIFLTQEEQGYWFTISSLAALIVLADLGFSNIILQFAAHEFAHLRFNDGMSISGDKKYLRRLSSLFVFSIKWVGSILLFAFPCIVIIGLFLLGQKTSTASWIAPWIIYVFGSSIMFLNSTLLFFFEGCNSIAISQKIRMFMSILMGAILSATLIFGFKLYALSFSLFLSSLLGLYLIFKVFRKSIVSFVEISRQHKHSWRKEFIPLFWKYAISWGSGYFLFQMYTPLMFHYEGAIAAGKIGMSITVWLGVFSLSNVWMYVITPRINKLVYRCEWGLLDKLFFKNLKLSGLTFCIGASMIFWILFFFKDRILLIDRLADMTTLFFLAAGWFLQIVVNAFAIYLRAHKEEPLLLPSFLSALYVVFTTFLCAKYLSTDYFFLGYLSSYVWGIPWIYTIYNKKRKSHLDGFYINPTAAYNSNSNV